MDQPAMGLDVMDEKAQDGGCKTQTNSIDDFHAGPGLPTM